MISPNFIVPRYLGIVFYLSMIGEPPVGIPQMQSYLKLFERTKRDPTTVGINRETRLSAISIAHCG
jgi:hypothetical protein